MRTKKLVLNSILVALSAIFSYVEAIIPIPLGIPGIKLGLANVVTVFALYRIGLSSAVLISAVRIIIVSALFANPMMALYSLAGAALSLTAMTILKRAKIFSIIGVCRAGFSSGGGYGNGRIVFLSFCTDSGGNADRCAYRHCIGQSDRTY